MSGEFIFINQTRLRLALDNFGSFSHLLSVFRASGVGSVTVAAGVDVETVARVALAAAIAGRR